VKKNVQPSFKMVADGVLLLSAWGDEEEEW
jgi:hypothetical protein